MRAQKLVVFALVAMSVVGMTAGPVVAAGGGLNYDSGNAPNPYYSADITISEYRVSDQGDLVYQNDNSEWVGLDAEINSTDDVDDLGTGYVNVWSYKATDIDESSYGEFPRNGDEDGDNSASFIDASEWTTTGAAVNDVTTAPNVDAVEFSASAAGDQATYNNWSSGETSFVQSDAEKRYLKTAYDVESASGASVVNMTIHDGADGDTIVVELYNSSANANDADVGANSTGEGIVVQQQLGQLTASGGDGNLDEIGKIVVAADGSANVDIAGADLESTSKWNYGTEWEDTDDDDDFETSTVYENTGGDIDIRDVSSMGSTFDDAEIHDVTVPAHVPAKLQADADISADFSEADSYPSFDQILDFKVRMVLPNQFDLSYANAELRMDQNWVDSRYATAEYAEAVGESTDLEEVEDSQYSSFSGSLGSEGTEIVIDSTVQPGDNNVVHLDLKLTGDEANAMQAAEASSGGGGGIIGGGGSLFTLPNIGIMAALGGVIQMLRGGWPFAG